MRPDVPNGSVNIQHDLRHCKLRLAAVDHLEYRLPFAGKYGRQPGINAVVIGYPTPADHPDDADSVWMLGLEDIHGQRHALFVAVDDVDNVVLIAGLGGGGTSNEDGKHDC